MTTDADGEREGEVTRVEAVKYLQGATGHSVGSLLFLLLGCLLWVAGYRAAGWIAFASVFLLSANGISIWAWEHLQQYFAARAPDEDSEPSRTLQIRPFASESFVEMQAALVMVFALVGVLVALRTGLRYLEPRTVGFLFVLLLGIGNVVALGWVGYTAIGDSS